VCLPLLQSLPPSLLPSLSLLTSLMDTFCSVNRGPTPPMGPVKGTAREKEEEERVVSTRTYCYSPLPPSLPPSLPPLLAYVPPSPPGGGGRE